MALQVRNLALLHRLAGTRVYDQTGHALDAIDVVLAGEWRVVGVMA